MNAPFVADSGLSTHGELNAIGIRKPPNAPTAPMTPIAAEACFVPANSAASRSVVPARVLRSASVRQIAGIILYVEPLPMPVAANTNRNATRNHGNHDGFSPAIAGSAVGFGVSWARLHSTTSVKTTMPTKAPRVTLAPPYLSASQPPSGRVPEPTRAPRNAKY